MKGGKMNSRIKLVMNSPKTHLDVVFKAIVDECNLLIPFY